MLKGVIILCLCIIFIKKSYSIQEIYPLITPSNCTNNQYFDIESFKCHECNHGFTKSENGVSCKCVGVNKYISYEKNSSKVQCLQCKLTEYSSNDHTTCVSRNCFKSANGKITCSLCRKNQIIMTNYPNGSAMHNVECVTCAPGYYPSNEKTLCLPCKFTKQPNINTTSCECDQKQYSSLNDVCIPNSFIRNISLFQGKSQSGELIKSIFIDKYFITSSYLCSLKNITACQILANMCAMSLYSNEKNSPCFLWRNSKNIDKNYIVPAVMYDEDESYSVLFRKKIGIVYNLNKNSENNHVNIVATKYNAFGEIIQNAEESVRWLMRCPSIWKLIEDDILKFGVNFRHHCRLGIYQLLEMETYFYEAFVKYSDIENKDTNTQLYAVPVLIKSDLINFNKESEINSWQLVRRFFIFDKISGMSNINGKNTLKYIRYAKYIEIKIRIRNKGKGERSKIYPPLIIIDYGEKDEDAIKDNEYVDMELVIKFELENNSMVNGMEIALGSLSAFVVLYSILQSWSHTRRSGKISIDIYSVIQFFIFSAGNLSNIFFLVAFGASTYSFLIYKGQKVIYTAILSNRDEYMIQTYLIVALSLKIIELMSVNWQQINIDICFVDWEKPNTTINDLGTKFANIKSDSQPTFWRPYFVANEWNEIQTLRKISLPIHLVGCVFVLDIFGASTWTYIGFNMSPENISGYLTSPAYQFALSGIIFLILYIIQIFISVFIYERYVENPISDFMDICSIANVSMLIFDEPLHGYYLHGRCVHAHCDTDVRGLQPGLPFRAFNVRCTNEFRIYFTRLQMHMVSKSQQWQWQHHISAGNGQININNSSNSASSRKLSAKSAVRNGMSSPTGSPQQPGFYQRAQAANLVNKFLTAFFDHALEDLNYEVREKRYIERLLDIELINEGNYKTLLLYNTSGDSQTFQKALWYGQEWTLITFDLYLFCLVQMTTGNYVLAALISAIIWKFLSICRKYGGKKNLAKKTLVDERFLI